MTFRNYQTQLKAYTDHPLFWIVLVIKLFAGSLFASDVMVKGFAPFIHYFVNSGFANPYDHFLSLGLIKAFPYPTVMLWLLSVPAIIADFFSQLGETINASSLLQIRVVTLAADLVILLVLSSWLVNKQKQLLWLYWASPLVFYVSYYHGQLDLVPTALLVLSIFALFKRKALLAFVILAIGLATKSHLILALPFFVIYLLNKKIAIPKLIGYLLAFAISYLVLLSPYLTSPGFIQLVLKAEEQQRFFAVNLPLINNLIYIALAAYLVLLFRFAAYRRITNDALMVFLGLMFTVLVTLVPPAPGWYLWSVPFLVYFFVKFPGAPVASFILFNISFLLFFLFAKNSDIFQAWQVFKPTVAGWPTPFEFLNQQGINATIIQNGLFTLLQTSLALNAYWTYRSGIKNWLERKLNERPTFIGIAGDSGVGKTTLSEDVLDLVGRQNALAIRGDDMHRWPRGHKKWQFFTHLNPKSNYLHLDMNDLMKLKQGQSIERSFYRHSDGQFSPPVVLRPNRFIIFEGLHPFYLADTRNLLDMKIFLEPQERLRIRWKLDRDKRLRGHDEKTILKQIKSRHKDAKQFIAPQKQFADIVITYHDIAMAITCSNSLEVEPLVENLKKNSDLKIEHSYDADLERQSINFQGRISADQISKIAYNLLPDLEDLIENQPKWHSGYEGISQLFILYQYIRLQENQYG